jgi:hypothetical protein
MPAALFAASRIFQIVQFQTQSPCNYRCRPRQTEGAALSECMMDQLEPLQDRCVSAR